MKGFQPPGANVEAVEPEAKLPGATRRLPPEVEEHAAEVKRGPKVI
jgi:hypothetical protein